MNKDENLLYYIIDPNGNICDKNLTYEEALILVDSYGWNQYHIKLMYKGGN